MCAQFMIKADLRRLENLFGIKVPRDWDDMSWAERIVPHTPAPVLLELDGSPTLRRMRFSLLPAWSKTDRVKFATHNARKETLAEKPTWRGPLQRQRCIVPLTDFIEPIYEGEWAGKMVAFHPANDDILTAAGLWDCWRSPDGEQTIFSFTIITSEPDAFIAGVGHDRMPVFLHPDKHADWLDQDERDSQKVLRLLDEGRMDVKLDVRKDRDMRPGWEKRK